jgi:hypothetical protein
MDQVYERKFRQLAVTTPCCGTATTLNDLNYDWPSGFASAALSVLNPGCGWLPEADVDSIADVLGHKLRQVLAHY